MTLGSNCVVIEFYNVGDEVLYIIRDRLLRLVGDLFLGYFKALEVLEEF
jgi:hypothetical protein